VPDDTLTLTLPDGRTLGYALWGDPGGRLVVQIHGTPGCRLIRSPRQDLVAQTGARVVTFDRAGYGLSDRNRGRRIVDVVVDDVVSLVDHLGVDTFAVTGGSGGGSHALAVAALLPERVTRVCCIVGSAPYPAMGEAWLAGMDPENVKEFGWAIEGEARLADELAREDAAMQERVAKDPANVLGEFDIPDADREVLSRPDIALIIRESVPEQSRHGVWGWVDDDLALIGDWGFDPASITVPTALWWGAHDVLVPPAHSEWLRSQIPDALTRVEERAGHQSDPDKTVVPLLQWLLDGTPWPNPNE